MTVAIPPLTEQPRLVFFHSSLSGHCRRVEGFLAQVLQRRRNHGTFDVVLVAEEERPDLHERFKIETVPTLVEPSALDSDALSHASRVRAVPGANVPFPPMEAQLVKELPDSGDWQFEPKWDGFRGVLENDGGELALWSRNGRPLLRYFPELRPLGDLLPPHSALDGEIVIARDGVLDFDSMQMRLHPAESRVRKLSAEIPADFIVFDLLLWKGKPIHEQPLEQRRAELERVGDGFHLSPTTGDAADAQKWLDSFEAAGLDGVIAKKLGLPYLPGSRDGVLKVKPHKTADCVIVGVRWKEKPTRIATLLLGLYGKGGKIDYVGSAAVAASRHKEIFDRIEPLLKDAPDRGFSEPNRWGSGELQESAVRPELVAEVRYDKVQGNRFRHGSRFLRFRDDKDPEQCTWREVRPARRKDDPTFESLLAS
jgi:ATP-dependent DNA ligase